MKEMDIKAELEKQQKKQSLYNKIISKMCPSKKNIQELIKNQIKDKSKK